MSINLKIHYTVAILLCGQLLFQKKNKSTRKLLTRNKKKIEEPTLKNISICF